MENNMLELYLNKARSMKRGSYTPIDEEVEKQKALITLIDLLTAETESERVKHYCYVAKDEALLMNLRSASELYRQAERIELGDR